LWTREECRVLEASGIDIEPYELIDGELINMSKNRPHINVQRLVFYWLLQVFGVEFVNQDAPIDAHPSDNRLNEPVPDVIVLNRESSGLVSGNPQPSEVMLAVEVSDTSLHADLSRKAALYARSGIIEYWVLDVISRRLIMHRNPVGGKYEWVVVYGAHECVAPLAAPMAELRVGWLFGA
jgi:Uma2 family endonuclease